MAGEFTRSAPAFFSDDELRVIIESWDLGDYDQFVTINLAHELLRKRDVLRRIFDAGRFPEGHHSAGDHEFCGSHHAECIALAREELEKVAALNQRGGGA